MGTLFRRLLYLFRQTRHEAELREEIEAHRALRAARLEREGLSPHEAADVSRRAIGNVLLARDDAREVWLGAWATWSQDVRYGLRTFRRNPMFTTVAVSTLVLGIGVNAGLFTVLNGVLLRGLPAPDPHELLSISQQVQGVPGLLGQGRFSTADYNVYRDRVQTLSGVAAVSNARGGTTLVGDAPQTVAGALVSCNYFTVLQQPPAYGRAFAEYDCESGAAPIVVLGHELWRTAFGADPGIVGRAIQLNRQFFTVVGVAAEGTYGGLFVRIDYFAPISAGRLLVSSDTRYDNEKFLWLNLIGRQRKGVSLALVRAELDVIAAQIDRPQSGRSTTLTIERAKPMTVPPGVRGMATAVAAVLMAAFGCILLIACANVANMLLARGSSRSSEIGIRLSLGASRARIVRQLVTESLLISLAGGLLGSMVGLWSFQALVALAVPALAPLGLPLSVTLWNVNPDVRVVVFAVVLTLVTGILVGLAPALQVSRPDLHAVMKQDTAGAGQSQRGTRMRGTLVGVQVALCMTLMMAAGLLLKGLYATYAIDPGFRYRDVSYASVESMFDGHTPDEFVDLRQRLLATLRATPGIDAVAFTDREPLGDDYATIAIRLPGQSESDSRIAQLNAVSADYFSVIGLRFVHGRAFTASESAGGATGSAIVSESTARNLWPGRVPIGRTLLSDVGTVQVVGVVADAQVTSLGEIDPYYVYVPGGGGSLLVKSRIGLAETASSVRAAVRTLDPTHVVTVLPLATTLGRWRGVSATVTTVAGGLGLLALALASVGVFGVVSYAVTGRYHEIGVRMALGATARNVLAMMLRQTMRPVVVGGVIGMAAAGALSRILGSVLFGVSTTDPVGLGGGAVLVAGVALAAGAIAARPATRADLAATLRNE
jgi:predicted permease